MTGGGDRHHTNLLSFYFITIPTMWDLWIENWEDLLFLLWIKTLRITDTRRLKYCIHERRPSRTRDLGDPLVGCLSCKRHRFTTSHTSRASCQMSPGRLHGVRVSELTQRPETRGNRQIPKHTTVTWQNEWHQMSSRTTTDHPTSEGRTESCIGNYLSLLFNLGLYKVSH